MKTLIVFVDSLGPEQVRLFGESLDFLDHRKNVRGTMGYTCGALPSLFTGVSPVDPGGMCLFSQPHPSDGTPLAALSWLGLLPRAVHERGALRRRVGKIFARARRMNGYFELYKVPPEDFSWLDAPEKEDLFAADEIEGFPTFLGAARQAGLSVYASPWQLAEQQRWEHAYDHLRNHAPDLSFLYTPVLDGMLHQEGPDSVSAQVAAQKIAGKIDRAQRILTRASGQQVRVLVVGDHGMAKVKRIVDPRKVGLERLGLRKFVDSTMIRLWGAPPSLVQARARLESAAPGGHWIAGEDRERRGIPARNDACGQAIYVLQEGSLFAPSYLGGAVRGMHGYDLSAISSQSAILSNSASVTSLDATTDVASWVLDDLGVEFNSSARCAA
jgi:hypothetical protein